MLQGDLATVPLTRLLTWIGEERKSGCLLVQQDRLSTRLFFRDGRIVACSSDDPVKLLGQFLIFRGAITEKTLSQALALQDDTGDSLRNILLEMGAVSRERLDIEVAEKAQETIYDLFEWSAASFWFCESIPVDENAMDVSFGLEEVVRGGTKRLDERERIRTILESQEIVLEKTDRKVSEEAFDGAPTRTLYESVDGERSIAELILRLRGTEYQVTRRLLRLHDEGLVRARQGGAAHHQDAPCDDAGEVQAGPWTGAEYPATAAEQLGPPTSKIPEVNGFLARGDYPAALELLDEIHRGAPGDESLREEIELVEAAFAQQCFREDFAPSSVPALTRSLGSMGESELPSTDMFLVGLVQDHRWDVKSLLWISPMRSVDVLLALRRLVDRGFVEMKSPEDVEPAEPAAVGGRS
jgi:hypothetical protein